MVHLLIPLVSALVGMLGFSGPRALGAQQESEPVGRLELGFDQSVPGEQTFIPIAFKPRAEAKVGKIMTEIVFSSKLLSFEEVRKGSPVKSIDAEVSTRVKTDEKNSENSILEVMITSKTGEAIPAGTLVYLTFRISLATPRAQMIKLENRSEAMTMDDPPERVELKTADGEIENLDISAVFACFFYMH